MITPTEIHELLEYRDGELYWKVDVGQRGKKGCRAGSLNKSPKYRVVRLKGKLYLEHRIVFAMHHGYFPEFIDHINEDKTDNRVENLRPATREENGWNQKNRINNTSGYKGVSYNNKDKRWVAYCRHNKNLVIFGRFMTKEEAARAVVAGREFLHKGFANHG